MLGGGNDVGEGGEQNNMHCQQSRCVGALFFKITVRNYLYF